MTFGEKNKEKNKKGQMVDVIRLPKYDQSKAKALDILKRYEDLKEGDFWILKNETKDGRIMYSGLIISHNACLKINDHLAEPDRFVPSCVELDKIGYNGSLVFTYCNDQQGIYEVGEVSPANCKNAYPYAMAYKRLFDRVVLKNSKIAYDGIYSDSEADEFREPLPDPEEAEDAKATEEARTAPLEAKYVKALKEQLAKAKKAPAEVEALKTDWKGYDQLTFDQWNAAMQELKAQ